MFRKIVNYFRTWFGMKAEAAMDPEVQIQQALEEGTKQHLRLKKAAAAVIANQKMIEKRMGSRVTEVAMYKKQAQTALLAVEREKTAGNLDKAEKFQQAANTLAVQWKATEQLLAQDKEQYAQAEIQAKAAQDAIYTNELKLQDERAKAQKLRSVAKQAQMQKALNEANDVMTSVGTLESSPTLASVEEKLNQRLSDEEAKRDIHGASADGVMQELKASSMQTEANDALDQLRQEMGLETEAPAPVETQTAEVAGESADANA